MTKRNIIFPLLILSISFLGVLAYSWDDYYFEGISVYGEVIPENSIENMGIQQIANIVEDKFLVAAAKDMGIEISNDKVLEALNAKSPAASSVENFRYIEEKRLG